MSRPTPMSQQAYDRGYYERQGRDALQSGIAMKCSEPSITEVVLRMAREHLSDSSLVLDVGCGANLDYDLTLVKRPMRIVAFDFSGNFLAMAPRSPGLVLAQADAATLPFRSAAFDAAICSEVLEHMDAAAGAVAEIARVLKPGGMLLLTVPNRLNASRLIDMIKTRRFSIELMSGHLREYSPASVRRLLNGRFSIEAVYPVAFGWDGRYGSRIDRLIRSGLLRRLSKSIAVAARRR